MVCSQFVSGAIALKIDCMLRIRPGLFITARGLRSKPMKSVLKSRWVCITLPGWKSTPWCFKIFPSDEGVFFFFKCESEALAKRKVCSWLNSQLGLGDMSVPHPHKTPQSAGWPCCEDAQPSNLQHWQLQRVKLWLPRLNSASAWRLRYVFL